MLPRLFAQLRSNAIAYIALFVALGGTAYAATALPPNSVGTPQLKNKAVTGRKVAKHTLTGANIKASTLGTVPNAAHLGGLTSAAFGRITRISAGTGLTGGGTRGRVNLAVDPTVVQARVTGTCGSGGAIGGIKPDGTVACHTTQVSQMMGGTGTATLSPTSDFMAPVGITTPSTQMQAVEAGSSNSPSMAGRLFVSVATVPASGASWAFDFYINGQEHTALKCVIASPAKSCHANGALKIPRGALVALHERGTNITAGTTATYGWTDKTF